MFTGLIEEVGTVRSIQPGTRSATITIAASAVLDGTRVGDSIAVSGVCLTVCSLDDARFAADAMPETLQRSTLGALRPGSPVNLERALRLSDRLGGHIVSGHIDGTGTIRSMTRDDNAVRISIAAQPAVLRYVVEKGSVALDGISLTVTAVDSAAFEVSVIPHTFDNTDLSKKRAGDMLNIECDIIGKYVEKLAAPVEAAGCEGAGITMAFLAENGF